MSDEEIRSLVERLLKSVLQGKRRKVKAPPAKPGMRVERPGPGTPHGIYVYDRRSNSWVLATVEGDAWDPEEDGLYMVYFDNTRCPACRLYDKYWFDFASTRGGEVNLVIVLCAWFAHECRSPAAAASFRKYEVHASPTTLILCRRNGEDIYVKKHEGILRLEELIAIYVDARKACGS